MATQKPPSVAHALHTEIEAARVFLANFKDILGDDAQARADGVEGETGILEAIETGLLRIAEIEILETGIERLLDNLKARQGRLAEQKQNLRTSITVAMELAERQRLETPIATVALMRVPPKLELVDEAAIPSEYWKPSAPKLDKKALTAALKDKKIVPGAQLDNGSITIQVTGR